MSAHLSVIGAGKTDDLGQRVSDVLARRATPSMRPSAMAVLKTLAAVPDNGGLTVNELAELLSLTNGNLHQQIRGLKEAGKVVPGEKIRIPGSHCYAMVWKLVT